MIYDQQLQAFIDNSCVYKDFPHRENFIRLLVRRLKTIPQLFPIDTHPTVRNRYVHIVNMLGIVKLIKFDCQIQRREAMLAVLTHDIGHAPFGHAGEKAISACLSNGSFLNYQQSTRLLSYYEIESLKNHRSIFNTKPLTLNVSFEENSFNAMSLLLDFIDDLENMIGDLKDVWIVTKHPYAKSIFSQYFGGENNISDNPLEIARQFINHHIGTFEFNALCTALEEDRYSLFQEIKVVRKIITLKAKELDEVMRFYEDAQQYMTSVFIRVREILRHEPEVGVNQLDFKATDLTSSLTIEGSWRQLKTSYESEVVHNTI